PASAPLPLSMPDLFDPAPNGTEGEAELRALMQQNVGVIRTGARLADALRAFAALEASADVEIRNMATAALLIAASAYARTESRGGHYRSDFPKADPAQARRSFVTLTGARAIAARANAKAA